jgi:argininosuccinate lyase
MTGMLRDMTFRTDRLAAAASASDTTAVDIADWLVREKGTPFREAHHVAGRLVKLAETNGCRLAQLSLADLQSVEPALTEAARAVLDVNAALKTRASFGGTAPVRVEEACAEARKRFLGGS